MAMRKLAVSLSDSTELRVILSVLYIMTEVLRQHEDESLREGFKAELSKSILQSLLAILATVSLYQTFPWRTSFWPSGC